MQWGCLISHRLCLPATPIGCVFGGGGSTRGGFLGFGLFYGPRYCKGFGPVSGAIWGAQGYVHLCTISKGLCARLNMRYIA